MKTLQIHKTVLWTLSAMTVSSAFADINHLATPTSYDNIGGPTSYGQTFLSQDTYISGVQVYVGDPARPTDPGINALTGPANLLLYNATNLASPILLASNSILSSTDTASGLTTFRFDRPIATTAGTRYFFGFDTTDSFGIGMRSLFSSTYSGGSEAYRDPTTGQLAEHSNGRDLSFKILAPELPTQKIYLAWGQDTPYTLSKSLFSLGSYEERPGTMHAATVTDAYKSEILSRVQSIFSASGVSNIEFTITPAAGATTVYFSDQQIDLFGKAKGGIDRFNKHSDDQVVVFVNGAEIDAETVAHEVGHTLGLIHVDPNGNTLAYPEVMDPDFDPGAQPRFINSVSRAFLSEVSLPGGGTQRIYNPALTSNPVYHLKRWVEGATDAQLATQGITPGNWDTPFGEFIRLQLSFNDSARIIYNVNLFETAGDSELLTGIAHFDSITLQALQAMSFDLGPGTSFALTASSLAGGIPDLLLATGDPNTQSNVLISPTTSPLSMFLQQATTGTEYQTIETATATGTVVPEPSTTLFGLTGILAFLVRRVRNGRNA